MSQEVDLTQEQKLALSVTWQQALTCVEQLANELEEAQASYAARSARNAVQALHGVRFQLVNGDKNEIRNADS
jgi:cystathionine beta-lyase/cystathionine gamma-synthase